MHRRAFASVLESMGLATQMIEVIGPANGKGLDHCELIVADEERVAKLRLLVDAAPATGDGMKPALIAIRPQTKNSSK